MERDENKQIDQKYIDLVERFKKEPIKRNVKRIKMLLDFICWYRIHRDILNEDEREFLQANIYRIDKNDLIEE